MFTALKRTLGSAEMLALYGRAVQYLSQFMMVLVVPKVLSPDAYVELNLVLPLAFLGVTLLFGWVSGSVHRFVHQFLDQGEIEIRQTVFFYFSIVSTICLMLFVGISQQVETIYGLVPLLLVATAHKRFLIGALNLSGRNRGYLFANLGFAVSLVLFIWLCYTDGREGLAANLLIYGCTDILISLLVWFKFTSGRINLRIRFHKAVASRYMRYGAPLVLNGIAVWIVSMSDRYILTLYESPDAIATYILNYQLGSNVIVIPLSFAVAVYLQKILRIDKERGLVEALDYSYRLLNVYKKYFLLFLVAAFAVVYLLTHYIYSEYAFDYGQILFLIVLAHLIQGFSHFYNKEFELNGKTYLITKSIGLGALVNVVFNFLLIPVIGILGAAISTLIAYAVTVFVVYRAREYRPEQN